MARWVVCGTIVPPMIDLGRANEIVSYATVDEAVACVRSMLERGKNVLVRRAEDEKVASNV